VAGAQLGDALDIDVESGDLELARERDGEGQTDIAEPDDDNPTDIDVLLP